MQCLVAKSSTVQAVGLHDTSTVWNVGKTWIFCIILRSRHFRLRSVEGKKIFQLTNLSKKFVFVYILLIHRMDIQNEVISQMFKHKL